MATVASPTNFADGSPQIGGYRITATLLPDQSWLAEAPGGRRVVLKTLDEDCLWKGQLHPNIRDRLGRVRELAHVGVANLYGVEREGGLTYLVWEYVEGRTLGEFAGSSKCGMRELASLARELALALEMLHARGIVHGAIKMSNVIIGEDGRVMLTHVSPLLYSDPAEDVQAVILMLQEIIASCGEEDSPLGQVLRAARESVEPSLRQLAARLGTLADAREIPVAEESDGAGAGWIRRRALMGAGATAVLAIGLFIGLKHYARGSTPRPPSPPQAAPEALEPAHGGDNAGASGWGGKRAAS